jgi:nitrite reductase (NADH) small subunit
MAFIKVGPVSMVPLDSVTEVISGENSYAICNVGGELHALEGICPHAGGPLGQGMLSNDTPDGPRLVCPWHCYEFDPVTGENLDNPFMRVAKIPVKVVGDDILIEVA